jgi:aryl-alcohol dehydrogenase-like predicted oxidoreductase
MVTLMMIHKLALGTVQMGLDYGINNSKGQISERESFEILKTAHRSGIEYLDTAESYGNAHAIIGEFHRGNPDYLFKVITKLPSGINSEMLEGKILDYRKTLGVPKPEAVMFHSYSTYRENPELISILKELKKDGKFNSLGVSVYNNDEIETLLDDPMAEIIQLPFNLLDNHEQRGEIVAEAKKRGKTIHTRSAFLQGLFFKNPVEDHPVVSPLKDELLKIRELSQRYNITVEGLALQYCLHQPYIDKVIVGVDSLKQLQANINACKEVLPEKVFDEINEIQLEEINLVNPALWN